MDKVAHLNAADTHDHLEDSKVISINLMPPGIDNDTMKILASCDECFEKVNEDAQKLVKSFEAHA